MSSNKDAQGYVVKGVDIVCPICHNDLFLEGHAQLNTQMATFFGFDWANRQVQTLTCSRCSNVLWFDNEP